MPTRIAIDISNDLVFSDPSLESGYRSHHTESQKTLDIQFHYARSLAWIVVGLRMLKDSSAFQHYMASAIVLLGAITTLIPAFLPRWLSPKRYLHYRPAVVFFDNVLQVSLGCFTHAHIYPEPASSWRTASTFRAIAVVTTGSGTSWLNMSGLLGSLIFRYAILQQAALAILMITATPSICHRSYSLQRAYMTIHQFVLNFLSFFPLFPSTTGITKDPSLLLPGSNEDITYALKVCETYQSINLTVLGMVLPMLYLFWREMKSRQQYAVIVARNVPNVDQVKLNPPPTLMNYFGFAAPAVAALMMYVVNFKTA